MAFKMNKNNVNFGEGTGSSPNKFSNMGAFGGFNAEQLRMQADAMDRMRKPLVDKMKELSGGKSELAKRTDSDGNSFASKINKAVSGISGGGSDEKLNAINKIINS